MYQDFFNKNDDYLNEFKQKVAEQKIASMEERKHELARARNNFLGTFAGVLLAGIVGWFVLAPQYEKTSQDIPTIHRPQTAVKVKPENRGGMEIPNQDKDIYNLVEKKDVDNTVIENLLPEPEKPKLPDIAPETTDINTAADNLDEIVEDVAAENDVLSEPLKKETAAIPDKPKDLLPKETGKSESKKAEPKETEVKQNTSTNGNWQIQLLASKNKVAVEQSWKTLSAKYSALKAYSHEVQSAEGGFYKLRAGNFASKAEAQQACDTLKSKGLKDCIARER